MTPMTSEGFAYLIDTNVLIYAYDTGDMAKRSRAIEVLKALRLSKRGVLSVQALGEFYVNVTRKPERRLSTSQALASTIRLSRAWQVLEIDLRIQYAAMRAVDEHSLSYWDALLWATASQNNVPFILTEDQQHSRLVDNVRYLNPFAADFDLSVLS